MNRENGQAVILVALLMVTVFAFAALSVDIGSELAHCIKLQKAADASALYGATVGPTDNWNVTTEVDNFLLTNYGIPSNEATVTPDQANQTVAVSLHQVNPFHLAPVIGFSKVTLIRSATASLQVPEAFRFAMFSNQDLNLTVNNIWLGGSAYAHGNINISCNNGTIDPNTEAHGQNVNISCNHFQSNIIENGPSIPMPDYSAELLKHAVTVHNGDLNISSNNYSVPGIIYVYGNVNISTNNVKGFGCIFATGDINVSSNNFDFGTGAVGLYSAHNINISANNLTGNGLIYAPHGDINLSLNNIKISNGAIIGEQITNSANTITVDSNNLSSFNVPMVAHLIG